MTLRDELGPAATVPGEKGMVGTEGDWQLLSPFELRGRHLQLVEKRIIGDAGPDTVTIPATPGQHVVEGRVMTFGSDKRVSRLRVRRRKAGNFRLGRLLGTISVDLGGIAVTDIDVLAPSIEENEGEYEAWIEEALFEADDRVGVLRWECGETDVPFACGGFGDGVYPVFELTEGGEALGMEVEFIAAGTPYPFGD